MAKVKVKKLSEEELYNRENDEAERALVMDGNDEPMRRNWEKYDTETWTNSRDDRRTVFFLTAINEAQPLEVRKTAFQKLRAICPEIDYFTDHQELIATLTEK